MESASTSSQDGEEEESCPCHPDAVLLLDDRTGDLVCAECGLVLFERDEPFEPSIACPSHPEHCLIVEGGCLLVCPVCGLVVTEGSEAVARYSASTERRKHDGVQSASVSNTGTNFCDLKTVSSPTEDNPVSRPKATKSSSATTPPRMIYNKFSTRKEAFAATRPIPSNHDRNVSCHTTTQKQDKLLHERTDIHVRERNGTTSSKFGIYSSPADLSRKGSMLLPLKEIEKSPAKTGKQQIHLESVDKNVSSKFTDHSVRSSAKLLGLKEKQGSPVKTGHNIKSERVDSNVCSKDSICRQMSTIIPQGNSVERYSMNVRVRVDMVGDSTFEVVDMSVSSGSTTDQFLPKTAHEQEKQNRTGHGKVCIVENRNDQFLPKTVYEQEQQNRTGHGKVPILENRNDDSNVARLKSRTCSITGNACTDVDVASSQRINELLPSSSNANHPLPRQINKGQGKKFEPSNLFCPMTIQEEEHKRTGHEALSLAKNNNEERITKKASKLKSSTTCSSTSENVSLDPPQKKLCKPVRKNMKITSNKQEKEELDVSDVFNKMPDALMIDPDVIDKAKETYDKARKLRKLCQCKKRILAAACVCLASREDGFPCTFYDLASHLNVSKCTIGKVFKLLVRSLGTSPGVMILSDFVSRFSSLLELSEPDQKCAFYVSEKIEKMNQKVTTAKMAALAVYIAANSSKNGTFVTFGDLQVVTGLNLHGLQEFYRELYYHNDLKYEVFMKNLSPPGQTEWKRCPDNPAVSKS